MMESKWIEYKGKQIIYLDFRGAANESDILKVLHQAIELIKAKNEPSLVMTNFENTHVSPAFIEQVTQFTKQFRHLFIKQAGLNITGIKNMMYNTYNFVTGQTNNKTFDNEEEAKNWLVE
jgi:hypothetical protein